MYALLIRLVVWTWASPWTLLGLFVGCGGLATGGGVQQRRGVIEFHGGCVAWLLAWTPVGAVALTLGHTILGRDALALERTRDHEHVHVRQYERWGPLFGPAYLGCSLFLWLNGRDAYLDNPFEKEAFGRAG